LQRTWRLKGILSPSRIQETDRHQHTLRDRHPMASSYSGYGAAAESAYSSNNHRPKEESKEGDASDDDSPPPQFSRAGTPRAAALAEAERLRLAAAAAAAPPPTFRQLMRAFLTAATEEESVGALYEARARSWAAHAQGYRRLVGSGYSPPQIRLVAPANTS